MYLDVVNSKWQVLEDTTFTTAEVEDVPFVYVMSYKDAQIGRASCRERV